MSFFSQLPESPVSAFHAGAARRMTAFNVISVLYRHFLIIHPLALFVKALAEDQLVILRWPYMYRYYELLFNKSINESSIGLTNLYSNTTSLALFRLILYALTDSILSMISKDIPLVIQ